MSPSLGSSVYGPGVPAASSSLPCTGQTHLRHQTVCGQRLPSHGQRWTRRQQRCWVSSGLKLEQRNRSPHRGHWLAASSNSCGGRRRDRVAGDKDRGHEGRTGAPARCPQAPGCGAEEPAEAQVPLEEQGAPVAQRGPLGRAVHEAARLQPGQRIGRGGRFRQHVFQRSARAARRVFRLSLSPGSLGVWCFPSATARDRAASMLSKHVAVLIVVVVLVVVVVVIVAA